MLVFQYFETHLMNVPLVLLQHAISTASLFVQRSHLSKEAQVALRHLERIDNRLAGNVDGLRVAGDAGWKVCLSQLENLGPGELCASGTLAIESKDPKRIAQIFALAESVPDTQKGLLATLGWVSPQFLDGTIKNLLASNSPFQRQVGITCCALHRADPGVALSAAIQDENVALRARALKTAGEIGRTDLLLLCESLITHENPEVRFWSSWSATLLGSANALQYLRDFGVQSGPYQLRALNLLLKVLPVTEAHTYLQTLSQSIQQHPTNQRALIHGAGITGDPFYIPWLIKQMDDLKLTRLAGEAFSFITGLDLAYLDLERKPPEDFESGPNDNPDDPNVDLDPDDNLPWPDPVKIAQWWQQNQQRFQNGSRYFMGAPVTREHCIHVLKEGYQRQRMAAAQYLCLLQPGSVLFPTSAPAWRQQRLLAKMV